MNEELIQKIYNDFVEIKSKRCTTHIYRVEMIKWVQKYHEQEAEFKRALEKITQNSFCIPDGKLLISCGESTCSNCHLQMYRKLLTKINFPYNY